MTALKSTKATDAEHEVKLEPRLISLSWRSGKARAGGIARFEVVTEFVGNGTKVKVTGKSEKGKKLGAVDALMRRNRLTGQFDVPADIDLDDRVFFEVRLPGNDLEGTSDLIPAAPPVKVNSLRWSCDEARRDDEVALSAFVDGVDEAEEVALTIYEFDRDGAHDKITELPGQVVDGRVEKKWRFEYHEDVDEIPTQEEMERYGGAYNPPEYFFTITVDGVEFGKKRASPHLLTFRDWIELSLCDSSGRPLANEDYELLLADGTKRTGTLDGEGKAKVDGVPPGRFQLKLANVRGSLAHGRPAVQQTCPKARAIAKVEGPSRIRVGGRAEYTAKRAQNADQSAPVKWRVSDIESEEVLEVETEIQQDTLILPCIPDSFKGKTVKVEAWQEEPEDGATFSSLVRYDEVGEYIARCRKLENAFPDWTGEAVLNALRRLAGCDDKRFQRMFGVAAADNLQEMCDSRRLPSGVAADDIKWLIEHSRHREKIDPPDDRSGAMKLKEQPQQKLEADLRGCATDCLGYPLAMGHVLCGISAGQHRNTSVRPHFLVVPGALGWHVDNLYAVTVAGDLGQSAVCVFLGDKSVLIGDDRATTEATYDELRGDVDGFVLGHHLKSLLNGRSLDKLPSDGGLRLSELLQTYYCVCEATASSSLPTAATRFAAFKRAGRHHLLDEIRQFALTFGYSKPIFQKLRALLVQKNFDESGEKQPEPVKHMKALIQRIYDEFLAWLDKHADAEAKR